jgi:hypothetical protein
MTAAKLPKQFRLCKMVTFQEGCSGSHCNARTFLKLLFKRAIEAAKPLACELTRRPANAGDKYSAVAPTSSKAWVGPDHLADFRMPALL